MLDLFFEPTIVLLTPWDKAHKKRLYWVSLFMDNLRF